MASAAAHLPEHVALTKTAVNGMLCVPPTVAGLVGESHVDLSTVIAILEERPGTALRSRTRLHRAVRRAGKLLPELTNDEIMNLTDAARHGLKHSADEPMEGLFHGVLNSAEFFAAQRFGHDANPTVEVCGVVRKPPFGPANSSGERWPEEN